MQHFIRFVLLLFLCFSLIPAGCAQSPPTYKNAFTVKFFGLSVHLRQTPYPELFKNRLDEQGIAVLNFGGIVGYDRFVVREVISVRLEQGLYSDCASSLAGFTHLGWRGQIFKTGRHSLNGGFGPTLVYRRDWNRLQNYEDDGYFNQSGDWQYKFYWYGGEVEYNYQLKGQYDLSLNLVPGIPELVSFGAGFRKRF
ncbi:hypothetical protein K3G39_11845 [Pontibacter sp. HSC-14F20]|uniref:hypothetical protein n=1 Tax=Pontibacter sp. HSC-14F20 TaxID=2864136 RepID=UPI001C735EE9|nr:hypothetical protein [Pontibacter sp. HSC-14F20]MBX0333928.1 hypothetical protein [Pontibacter sp. HSC-14F20]